MIKKSKRVTLYTLGCRLNSAESGSMAQQFTDAGYQVVPFGQTSDLVFINSCSVTAAAEASCRNVIRRSKKISPNAIVVVSGCLAQTATKQLNNMPEVDLVIPLDRKGDTIEIVSRLLNSPGHLNNTINNRSYDNISNSSGSRGDAFYEGKTSRAEAIHTRAFLKIQDGCSYYCSYCIVPYARGGEFRSLPADQVLKSIDDLLSQGFKEVVLTGVNLGEYYDANEGMDLQGLISKLFNHRRLYPEQKWRLRLSSIEPNKVSEKLLKTLSTEGEGIFMPHFHIPLQSGDNFILTEMGRRYATSNYLEVLELIKKYFPLAGIGTDVIVGFPGELEAHFKNTYEMLLNANQITHLHIFPFSPRPQTKAHSKWQSMQSTSRTPPGVVKARVKILRELGEKKIMTFAQEMLGKEVEVLLERPLEHPDATESMEQPSGITYSGHTPNFLPVSVNIKELSRIPDHLQGYQKKDPGPIVISTNSSLTNQIVVVKLYSYSKGKLVGYNI